MKITNEKLLQMYFILSGVLTIMVIFLSLVNIFHVTTASAEPKAIKFETKQIQTPMPTEIVVHEPPSLTAEQKIDSYIYEIAASYNLDPYLVQSIVWHESRYNPEAENYDGSCVGLMQVSTYWHRDRAKKLGVTDFYDPKSNILVGCDYLAELFETREDPALVLMMYNGNHSSAIKKYRAGEISGYAKSVLNRQQQLRKEAFS